MQQEGEDLKLNTPNMNAIDKVLKLIFDLVIIIFIRGRDYMIHYTQVEGVGTIKNCPTPIMCNLDGCVQLTQVINLPRSPLLIIDNEMNYFLLAKYIALFELVNYIDL